MADSKIQRPLPTRRWYSVLTSTTLTTTDTVYNTFNGRKFSDYDVLIFTVGNTGDDIRNSIIIPTSIWVSNRRLVFTVFHGEGSVDKTNFTIAYNSDTSIKAYNGLSATIKILNIYGGKIE